MDRKLTWGLLVCLVTFSLGYKVNAHIMPGSASVDYVLSHSSGYPEGTDGAVITRQQVFNNVVPGGVPGGKPAWLPSAILSDDSGTDTPGTSFAVGSTFFFNPSSLTAFPRVSKFSSVEQDNKENTAVEPAKLNLAFDASFDLDGNAWAMPIPLIMSVHGYIGDGADAFIQFELQANYKLYDSGGAEVAPDNLGDPVASDGMETLGGSTLITASDHLNGGGRIMREANGGSGTVNPFLISNYGHYTFQYANPMALGMPYPVELENRDFKAPKLFIPPTAVRLEITGFFEFQARNDGSPSGITIGETVIPEPGTLVLAALFLTLLIGSRRTA